MDDWDEWDELDELYPYYCTCPECACTAHVVGEDMVCGGCIFGWHEGMRDPSEPPDRAQDEP
jgi:hypothetical protein